MSRPTTVRAAGIIAILASILVLQGCLTVDSKEYIYRINPDGSGTGTIIFRNIASVQEESTDQTARDYTELVLQYVKGKRFEEQFPQYSHVEKKIYEENGELTGMVTFRFLTPEDVGLRKPVAGCGWMYYGGGTSGIAIEQITASNGTYGGEELPVIIWPDGTSEFRITTSLHDRASQSAVSLLPLYRRVGVN